MYYMAKQDSHTDSQLKKIYELKNIAVVGMSTNKEKAGHFVPKYLIQQGFNVIPVNPTVSEVLGRRAYSTVSDIPENQRMCLPLLTMQSTKRIILR
jgi:predicted CoA-binding protein